MPKHYRDAATGQHTTAEDAAARPAETVAETVEARHETPDVAELRRLAEAAEQFVHHGGTSPALVHLPASAVLSLLGHLTRAARAWDEGGDFVSRHPGMSAEYVRAANPYRQPEGNRA